MAHSKLSILKHIGIKQQILLLSGLLLFTCFSQAAVRLPSANRECASCHIMWLSEFKRKDVSTLIPYNPKPVMKSGKQDVASTDPMCFSCHDGFVLESRFLWEGNKHSHPTGQKPSRKISIPRLNGKNVLPLNDDGKIYCGTCHSAHGVDWEQNETAVFMRIANEDGQLCVTCHKVKTRGPKHGFHPLKRKIQKLLNKPPRKLMEAGARFANNGHVICQSCHKPHGAEEKKLLLVKNDKSQLCGECHINRYSKSLAHAGQSGNHPINIKPKNAKIPDSMMQRGSKLSKTGEIICQTCHRPHQAEPETSLLVKKNIKDSLCQDCHADKRQVSGSKHDMRLAAKNSKNIRNQVAGNSGPCSACHVPHKGTGAKMWARPLKLPDMFRQDSMASLCLSCHTKDGLAKKHTVGQFSHPVGIPVSKLKKTIALPTFSDNGIKWQDVIKGKVSCASCHDPHQWDPNDINHKALPGEKGDATNRFLRIANNEELALCKSCHEEKWSITNTKHDMRRMAPHAKNIAGQTADESGICGSCHLVHNANGNHLWARADISGQNTSYIACLGCHNKKGLGKKKTPGNHSHPLNVDIKNLGISATPDNWEIDQKKTDYPETRLVPLPLFDASGKPASKNGLVGCGSCHDPHTWSTQSNMTKGNGNMANKNLTQQEGNTSSSFLRIADQSLSKLCVNCHIEKKSIYFSKHDLTEQYGKLSTQLEENQKNENHIRHLAGPCSLCHRPHNATGPALWTRKKGPGKTAIAALCTDCHQQYGIAENKLPAKHSHPLGGDTSRLHHDKRIPTFDKDGQRQKDGKGLIDCASCHNPHRWDPQDINNRSLPMLGEDGDTSNSFLRLSANSNSELCLACHADKRTIIGTDHDLKYNTPDARNNLLQAQNVSGLCGQCHVPHNSLEDIYLWSRKKGPGDDPIEQRCRSCHNSLGFAAHKNPELTNHPQQIKIWSTKIRKEIHPGKKLPDIPVFDKSGRRSEFGSITCASCHNPHQWSADKKIQPPWRATKNPGNKEGDARSSFLRARNSENIVCTECHGNDAIYRYKYFHSRSTHKK